MVDCLLYVYDSGCNPGSNRLLQPRLNARWALTDLLDYSRFMAQR